MKTLNYLAHETKNKKLKTKFKRWRITKVQGKMSYFKESDKSGEELPQRYESL